jgi:hypothetical protein
MDMISQDHIRPDLTAGQDEGSDFVEKEISVFCIPE